MQIIISHDVDHISAFEHLKDLFLPKYIVRNFLELCNKSIAFSEFTGRFKSICMNRLNNIDELVQFDIENIVEPTFFLAVGKGKSLSYGKKKAKYVAQFILESGIKLGLHGIDSNSPGKIKAEFELFKEITNLNLFGNRMHYLNLNRNTLQYLNKTGYTFDSSEFAMANPYRTGEMWEFPINLMDTYLFYGDSILQKKSFEQLKEETLQIISNAEKTGIEYFTITTHDFYFTDSFKIPKKWYIWMIDYLKKSGYKFITFENAIKKLNYI